MVFAVSRADGDSDGGYGDRGEIMELKEEKAKRDEEELLAALIAASPAKCAYLTRKIVRLKTKRKK